jgi:hypothetical protein
MVHALVDWQQHSEVCCLEGRWVREAMQWGYHVRADVNEERRKVNKEKPKRTE